MADLKAFARDFMQKVFNEGDLAVIDAIVDDGFVEHEEFPGVSNDKAGLVEFVKQTRAAFPDLVFEPVALVEEGDEVWVMVTISGTHQGEFLGVPATGNKVETTAVDRIRVRDGKVVEHWGVTDVLTMMQQMGVIPDAP